MSPTTESAPYSTCVLYNQSRHACNSVISELRTVWGATIRILQVVPDTGSGAQPLEGVDGHLCIRAGGWGDLDHFADRLAAFRATDPALDAAIRAGDAVFMPGWSALAEAGETARKIRQTGLVWPGTEPAAADLLEKVGFKRLCEQQGAPTPTFSVITEQQEGSDTSPEHLSACIEEIAQTVLELGLTKQVMLKSVHGGGGRGTATLLDPSHRNAVRVAAAKVVGEMKRADGVYVEERISPKDGSGFFQIELELDGTTVANGGRIVWFNDKMQKVVEIGMSDRLVTRFIDPELYAKARGWAAAVAEQAGNNTRATMEALIYTDPDTDESKLAFIECNRRPQVENEALAFLETDPGTGCRRYTFAELMRRARGHAAPRFEAAAGVECAVHIRWIHGDLDGAGKLKYQGGTVTGMEGPRPEWVVSELIAPGEIAFNSDPQIGKAVLTAASWEQACERAAHYLAIRRPRIVDGPCTTYGAALRALFRDPTFVACQRASNATFDGLALGGDSTPGRTVDTILRETVVPLMLEGYRAGEGVSPEAWPTRSVCDRVAEHVETLERTRRRPTCFSRFASGDLEYDAYVDGLQAQLALQGGGQIRIKNPGQGLDWTVDNVWAHVAVIREAFIDAGVADPVIYVHNHDFDGRASHTAFGLLRRAQAEGFGYLVVDAAYRKNGTHNDNTVVCAALTLTPEQRAALTKYNSVQQSIEQLVCRFDSRTSQMTPWTSDWAGGTEGSDLRIAKEYQIDPHDVNLAKEIASAVFPLERAVTPFSEYKLRLGLAIMVEPGITPKSTEAVMEWIAQGGKLQVGGDVLIGLHRWESLAPKPPQVDLFLANMQAELDVALASAKDASSHTTHTAHSHHSTLVCSGFGAKGSRFVEQQAGGAKDLTCMLLAPHVLHARPRSTRPGTTFDLLTQQLGQTPRGHSRVERVEFVRAQEDGAHVSIEFRHRGQSVHVTVPNPDAACVGSEDTAQQRRTDPSNECHIGAEIPGELTKYSVQIGDKLVAGNKLCVVESMKMEVVIPVPQRVDTTGVRWFTVSWRQCAQRCRKRRSDALPAEAHHLTSAMRHAIRYQTRQWRQAVPHPERKCAGCGGAATLQVDHRDPSFYVIKTEFLAACNPGTIPCEFAFHRPSCGRKFRPLDAAFKRRWQLYHCHRASFQLLCRSCNARKSTRATVTRDVQAPPGVCPKCPYA